VEFKRLIKEITVKGGIGATVYPKAEEIMIESNKPVTAAFIHNGSIARSYRLVLYSRSSSIRNSSYPTGIPRAQRKLSVYLAADGKCDWRGSLIHLLRASCKQNLGGENSQE